LPIQTNNGAIRVKGHVRGYLSGMVDADFNGTVYGTINAAVEAGAIQQDTPQLSEAGLGKERGDDEANSQ
jgi:hypothetical protein